MGTPHFWEGLQEQRAGIPVSDLPERPDCTNPDFAVLVPEQVGEGRKRWTSQIRQARPVLDADIVPCPFLIAYGFVPDLDQGMCRSIPHILVTVAERCKKGAGRRNVPGLSEGNRSLPADFAALVFKHKDQ
jgi:hypothetical protein